MKTLMKCASVLLFLFSTWAFALIDINSASKAELESLPGVGPSTADAIIAARPFKTIEELKKIKGMGKKHYNKVASLVEASQENITETTKTVVHKVKKAGQEMVSSEPVNINTASRDDLEKLPGIGPQRADDIISGRPYEKPEDVMKVKGIKSGLFAKIKDHITVR